MANTTPIFDAIKKQDWATATEGVKALLHQKATQRLHPERVEAGKSLSEGAVAQEDFGATKVCKSCKHPASEHSDDGCERKGCRCMSLGEAIKIKKGDTVRILKNSDTSINAHGNVSRVDARGVYVDNVHAPFAGTYKETLVPYGGFRKVTRNTRNERRLNETAGFPTDWQKGFGFPYQIAGGGSETPFLKNGKWHLLVYNRHTGQREVYSYADDIFIPEKQFYAESFVTEGFRPGEKVRLKGVSVYGGGYAALDSNGKRKVVPIGTVGEYVRADGPDWSVVWFPGWYQSHQIRTQDLVSNRVSESFIIVKGSRDSKTPYEGPACKDAGVEPGKRYDSKDAAEADAKKLKKANPAGFEVVSESLDVAWNEAAGDKCDDCGKAAGEVLTDNGKTVCKACAHKRGMATFRTEAKEARCHRCGKVLTKQNCDEPEYEMCNACADLSYDEYNADDLGEAWEKDPNCQQCRKPLSAADAKLGRVCSKCVAGNKTKIYAKEGTLKEFPFGIQEESLPHTTVQRVYDETGDVSETEILCGVRDLKVNAHGDVVSYVSEAYDPGSAKRHECPKCKHVWWGAALKQCPGCQRTIKEDTEEDRIYRRTYGWDRKGKVIFSAPGRLTLDDVKEVSPEVVKVDVRGSEYSGTEDRYGFANFNVYKDWGTPKEVVARLARVGVPAEPSQSPYIDMIAVSVPTRYAKKAGRELYGESVAARGANASINTTMQSRTVLSLSEGNYVPVKADATAFASDLGFPVGRWPVVVRHDGDVFTHIKTVRDQENDIQYMDYRAPNGRRLQVFND